MEGIATCLLVFFSDSIHKKHLKQNVHQTLNWKSFKSHVSHHSMFLLTGSWITPIPKSRPPAAEKADKNDQKCSDSAELNADAACWHLRCALNCWRFKSFLILPCCLTLIQSGESSYFPKTGCLLTYSPKAKPPVGVMSPDVASIHPGSICRKHVAADAVFPFHASYGEASHQHGDKPQIAVPAMLYEPMAGTISGPAPSFHMRPCPISLASLWKQRRAPNGAKERPKNTSPTLAS